MLKLYEPSVPVNFLWIYAIFRGYREFLKRRVLPLSCEPRQTRPPRQELLHHALFDRLLLGDEALEAGDQFVSVIADTSNDSLLFDGQIWNSVEPTCWKLRPCRFPPAWNMSIWSWPARDRRNAFT